MNRAARSTPIVLALALVAAGCSGGGGGGGYASTVAPSTSSGGQLSVELTDAPLKDLTGVTKAEIVVTRVLIHAAAVGSSTSAAPTTAMSGAAASGATPAAGAGQPAAPAQGQGAVNAHGQNPNAGGANSQGQNAQGQNANAGGASSQGQGQNAGGQNPNAGGANSQGQGNGNGPGNGTWITIFDAASAGGPKAFNLLDLRGGITAELASAQLPAGSYTHLRLELASAELVRNQTSYSTQNGMLTLTGSSTVEIHFAGKQQLVIQAGQTSQALLDFDVARSFDVVGNPSAPQGFKLLPVIRGANLAQSGAVAGVVKGDNGTPQDPSDDQPLANATITATLKGATVTTYSDAQGVYFLPGLEEGDWDLLFQATGHADQAHTAVTVTRRQQATLDATLAKK
ncbi:MAG: DUF4382 domain-containing protein [Planctomycetota bacterium]